MLSPVMALQIVIIIILVAPPGELLQTETSKTIRNFTATWSITGLSVCLGRCLGEVYIFGEDSLVTRVFDAS